MTHSAAIIDGALHVDDRGSLASFNEFAFAGVERFYIIRPSRPHSVRGWIGHRCEGKWFTAVEGVVAVAVVRPDNWHEPVRTLTAAKFVLAANEPRILAVPPGHATAIIGITPQSALMVLSTGKIEDASSDAYRFPPDFWAVPDLASHSQCKSF